MKEQVLATWEIHHNMNCLLFDSLTAAQLQITLSTRGGRTIGQQFIHLHNTRMQGLEICAPAIFKKYKDSPAILTAPKNSAQSTGRIPTRVSANCSLKAGITAAY